MLIASRKLRLVAETGDPDIEVRIFAPEEHDKDWSCRYEIDWPDGVEASRIYGFDSVQALCLTLKQFSVSAYITEYYRSGRLMWERPGGGYGFPVPKNARDLLIGDDRIFEGDN